MDLLSGATLLGETTCAITLGSVANIRLSSTGFGGSTDVLLRNDGSSFYLLKTATGDQGGSYDSTRPLRLDFATGRIMLGSGAQLAGSSGTYYSIGLWSDYTPQVLSESTSAPIALGAGTAIGRWTRLGDTVYCKGQMTLGTGFAVGTGRWNITLPFLPIDETAGALQMNSSLGMVWLSHNGSAYSIGQASLKAGVGFIAYGPAAGTGTTVSAMGGSGAASPMGTAWASAGFIRWQLAYQTAEG